MKKTMISAACAIAAALALMPVGASAQGTDSTRSTRDTSKTRPTTSMPATPQTRSSSASSRPTGMRGTGAISDSAIIAMLQLSHTQELAAADLALTKSSSERVKAFATELKTDHSKALEELQTYAQKMANGGNAGMASGMAGSRSGMNDSASTGRSTSSMAGRRDSSMSGQRDSAMAGSMSARRDSSMTGRDNSTMAGRRDSTQRDSSSSKMVQNDLPPGADTSKSRTYRDSTSMGHRDSVATTRQSGVTGQAGVSGGVAGQSGVSAGVSGQAGVNGPEITFAGLQSLSGHEFDHGFIRLQVQHHEEEINHLRNDIIPMIKDSGLRNIVQGQLPTMGKHLREARDLEAYLKTVQ